ncbi:hypothetical protein EDB80DRAFT_876698 [Ilyonectria destructans]|nr:hypothetical protein EDB80DRAFT_876698 [Ilyonectria destructans]
MDRKRLQHDDHAETSSSYPTKRQRTLPNGLDNTIHEPQNGSPSHDDYTIAWICALHIEMAAARAMLDEIHEDLPRYANDSNTYTLGSVKEHNIVIACLPTAQYGTNNAANVLTHLIRTFPSIRLGLMVGIGGGVPSMADTRLGDIVVGTRVMQCDLGKIIGDGQIWRTATPRILQHQVGTLVSTLRSTHELEPSQVPSILQERLEEYPEYGRPSLPDYLFHASYGHVSSTPSCDGCDDSKLVPRTRRVSDDPLIHYGAIASGNQVMRSGTARDDIARELDDGCPCLSALKDLFRNAVFALGQRSFTCFIDALDECDEQQVVDMVQYFEELVEQSAKGTLLRICFSSRHYPYIVLRQGIRLTLEDQTGHAEDLENYIGSRLRINDPALVEELQPQLLEKAAGVFLWVVLVVEILNKEYRQGGLALRKRLVEIPSRLSELFKDILRRDNENMEHLLLCILWILYSKRPLRPEEFYMLFDASGCIERCVISSSKGLAEITKSKQQPTVQFIHESVRDFLIKDKGLHEFWPDLGFDWEVPSHERLKQCCSAYMNNHLARISMADSNEEGAISKQFPFLEYASCHVLSHADIAARAISQDEFLTKFPASDWITIINRFERYKARQYTPDASLHYILADKGFAGLIRTRPKKHPCIYLPGERYRYPLFAALANGHKHAVAALFDLSSSFYNGVDIAEGLTCRKDFTGYKDRTPLSWAAQNGRTGIIELLLQGRITVTEADKGGRWPLSRASEKGHEATVRLLLEKGSISDL